MKRFVALVAVLLALAAINVAHADPDYSDDACGVGVNAQTITAANAARVANGFNCPAVDLTIAASLAVPPGLQTLQIRARTIVITGPIDIVNSNPKSDIFLTAVGGTLPGGPFVKFSRANIRAHDTVKVECQLPGCVIDIEDSEIIASFSLLPLRSKEGDLRIRANGTVDIRNTTTWGGGKLVLTADQGSLTHVCGGASGCQNPLTSGTALALCGPDPNDPTKPKLPCTPTFSTLEQIARFCNPTNEVACGGGESETNFSARDDITLAGSAYTVFEHFTIESKLGRCDLRNVGITAVVVSVVCRKDIDLTNADIFTSSFTRVTAGADCAVADPVCIKAPGLTLEANDIRFRANNNQGVIDVCGAVLVAGSATDNKFPVLNGDSKPPYVTNVLDALADGCTVAGSLN